MAVLPFRQRKAAHEPRRPLTASAAVLTVSDRREASRVRSLRQGWQEEAWAYRDAIGELHYAFSFIAHAASRMRYYPAAYPSGSFDDEPVPLAESGLSEEAQVSAYVAMNAFASGQVAMAEKMGRLSENASVAGEAFILGRTDPETGQDTWTVRSVDEIVMQASAPDASGVKSFYALREVPTGLAGSTYQAQPLPANLTCLARVWNPHPRFAQLADCSMRAILDHCEELLILSKNIRAVGRSALAGNGMLLMPSSMKSRSSASGEDNLDPQSQPFIADLTEAMMAPIADEGSATAVVPHVVWGDITDIAAVRHLVFARPLDPLLAAQRAELLGRIATGIDLPREILTGIADLNHWSAWQVDDNVFRHHLEPHVISICDMLAVGFLRPYMLARGCDPAEVARVVTWYDPTALVTHPDLTATAQALYNVDAISAEALRRACGFKETDAPLPFELELRLVRNTRNWPPNVLMGLLAKLDPLLTIPAITTAGTIPGIKAGGVDIPLPPVAGLPPSGTPANPGPPPTAGTPADARGTPPPAPPLVASAARLSRHLAEIDSALRTRLQAAANAAMARVLEKAGGKLRNKLGQRHQPPLIQQQRSNPTPNVALAAALGPGLVSDAGLSASDLTATDWSELREIFSFWIGAAHADALDTACSLAGVSPDSPAARAAREDQSRSAEAAWQDFESMMTARAAQLVFAPVPPSQEAPEPWAGANPDTYVPTGMIRGVLAVAGGAAASAAALGYSPAGNGGLSSPVGQIGTGSTISDLLTSAGATRAAYEWKHGAPRNPFDPHVELDGVQFASFTDDQLANRGDFPDSRYFLPGDHPGCTCDFQPLWEPSSAPVGAGAISVQQPMYPLWQGADSGVLAPSNIGAEPVPRSTTPHSGGLYPHEQKPET